MIADAAGLLTSHAAPVVVLAFLVWAIAAASLYLSSKGRQP